MMVAAGWLLVITRLIGRITRVLGAMPKLHIRVAPLQTCIGIRLILSVRAGRVNPPPRSRCARLHCYTRRQKCLRITRFPGGEGFSRQRTLQPPRAASDKPG